MISRATIDRVFSAATIMRWNDSVRPVDLTELDKQAHKAMIAFLLARFEEDAGHEVNWIELVEGFCFEFFPRVVLTDIKAPVFHNLLEKNGPAIHEHVVQTLKDEMAAIDTGFAGRFEDYLVNPVETREKHILGAAHYLATRWEFRLIYHSSPFMFGIEETKKEVEERLEQFTDLAGVPRTGPGRPAAGFIDLCGQLRFQQRWSQTVRTPKTSVLGHSLMVAMLGYLLMFDLDACDRRRRNAFFDGLFHDLPEALTRDIISPVKNSVEGLDALITEEEHRLINKKLMPLIPEPWHDEMHYLIDDPFHTRIREDGVARQVAPEEIQEQYNSDEFEPIDGKFLRGCDHLAAFLEADGSIKHGVSSDQLVSGRESIFADYRDKSYLGISWSDYFSG